MRYKKIMMDKSTIDVLDEYENLMNSKAMLLFEGFIFSLFISLFIYVNLPGALIGFPLTLILTSALLTLTYLMYSLFIKLLWGR